MDSNKGPHSLGDLIVAVIAGLPAALSKSAIGVLNRLVMGVGDIPTAYLVGWKERIEDTNFERRLLRRSLAETAVAKATSDPALIDRTVDRLLLEHSIKQANRESVAREAASRLGSIQGESNYENEKVVDDDWMNQFIRFSEDASSERLRSLFAKVLAGEIINPGAFSPATLRSVSELTQSLAQDFQWIWAKRINHEVWKAPEFNRGEAWDKLRRLRDAGLLSPVDAGIHQPQFSPNPAVDGLSLWRLAAGDDSFLQIAMKAATDAWLPVVNFTATGLELGKLLPTPNYAASLRAVVLGFPKQQVAWIEYSSSTTLSEMIWSED